MCKHACPSSRATSCLLPPTKSCFLLHPLQPSEFFPPKTQIDTRLSPSAVKQDQVPVLGRTALMSLCFDGRDGITAPWSCQIMGRAGLTGRHHFGAFQVLRLHLRLFSRCGMAPSCGRELTVTEPSLKGLTSVLPNFQSRTHQQG